MSAALEKPRIREIEAQIVTLWNGCEDAIQEIHAKADLAIRIAWQVGKLLIEAKKEIGHGGFQMWKSNLGIPDGTAYNYMALASRFSTIEKLPANKRQAYLAIGLLPDKEAVIHDGDTSLTPSNHYLSFFNRWQNFCNQLKIGKVKVADERKMLVDTEPLYQWFKTKREEQGLPL